MNKLSAGKASIFALIATLLVSAFLLGKSITSVFASPPSVTICHRTGSDSNPYEKQSPDIQNDGSLTGGHLDHTGPVWFAGIDGKWGDIIPAYDWLSCPDKYKLDGSVCKRKDYPDVTPTSHHYGGMNLTTDGLAILANNCNIPTSPVDVCPNIDGNQATVPDGDYINNDGQCVPKTHVCTDPLATNFDDNFNDATEVSDVKVCTYREDVCPNLDGTQNSLPDGYHFETINDVRTCVPDPTPTPLVCTGDTHPDATGQNCVSFSPSGPPPNNGGPAPQGQVLGASTMAKTGSFAEDAYLAIMALGALLSGKSIKDIKKAFQKA